MTNDRKTILVIDDDNRNTFALSAVLRSKGFACITAPGMKEAFDVMHAGRQIDLLLIDMMMPEMDGYEAIPIIKSQTNIPVIAVTAQAMAGDKEKCLAAGADDYMPKPVDVDVLINMLAKHLQ